MFRTVIFRLILLLLLLSAAIATGVWCVITNERVNSVVFFLIAAFVTVLIIRVFTYHTKKLNFLFNAIESDDYTFKFIEYEGSMQKDLMNRTMNRIKDLLVKAKINAIEKEQYYELILSSVNTGVIVINRNGSVYQKNNEAMRLLGMNVLTHINQLGRIDESLPAIFAGLAAGDNRQISVSNERGDLSLSVHVSALDLQGESFRIVAIGDIGSQLDEKELESWSRLIRVLTHEIMNSISPITSLSDTLIDIHGRDKQDDISNGLEVISTTSKSLMSFVQSYRQFSSVPEPKLELFYVNRFVNRLICLAQNEESAEGITFQTDIQPDDLILYADENQISQVVINLLKNAIQALHGHPRGTIKVSAYCDENEYVILEVANNGHPIPPEEASHIFIPFFTTKDSGSGIGLSLSRQIMRLHNGSLRLRVSNETHTVFTLKFK